MLRAAWKAIAEKRALERIEALGPDAEAEDWKP
jgi:hypothetical protein